ncbi:uncharacterized protein LOC143025308 [Oratosquilla oratoria]|uniref:uncharacterized protein LOC143025308 n=1 Tax=Oratosquilla oratoria TaxID=337810 RepID=UPI003F762DBA
MPVDAAHHRLLHHGGSSPFPSFCPRYTALAPVPMVNGHGGGGVVEAVSEESGGDGAPSPPPPVKPPRVETVVKVTSKGRTRVSVGERGNSYTPVVRPCAKLKDSGRPPVAYSRKVGRGGRGGARRGLRGHRYAPLGKEEDEDEEDSSPRSASRPNYGLLRAVTNRGRGYEDLRSRGATDEDLDSGDSSAASTSSPTPRQSGQSSPRDSSPTDPGGVGTWAPGIQGTHRNPDHLGPRAVWQSNVSPGNLSSRHLPTIVSLPG